MARSLNWFASAMGLALLAVLPATTRGQNDVTQQFKQLAVSVESTNEEGKIIGSGSGFLAAGKGIVITNAHVIGMLEKNSKPPAKVEVRSQQNKGTAAKILAIDRSTDLAVLRLEGNQPIIPQFPLPRTELAENQKLVFWVFLPGKNAVSQGEATVSFISRDPARALQKIALKGTIDPGYSGGLVIGATGDVVGVVVSVVQDKPITFAIPIAKVNSLIRGKLEEFKAGELYRKKESGLFNSGNEVYLPLKCFCVDPFKRIREVHVDVWAGKPADKYSISSKPPTLPKDATRQTYKMTYENDCAALDVLLPKLAEGQVAWVQPVLIIDKELPRYLEPRAFDSKLAVELVPAELVVKFPDKKLRTVHLKTVDSEGQERNTTEFDVLESLSADARGAIVRTGLASLNLSAQKGDAKKPIAEAAALLTKYAPVYLVDPTNKLRKKFHAQLNVKLDPVKEKETILWLARVMVGYECANFVLPNKQWQPHETWQANSPMMLAFNGQQIEELLPDMAITYSYEGLRTRSGNREALISFEGRMILPMEKKDAKEAKEAVAWVAGKFTFDLTHGFISSTKMTISDVLEADNPMTIDLARVEGNPKDIALPQMNESILKQARAYSLADVEPLLKNLAEIKVNNDHFVSVKDSMDGDKNIFGNVPAWLKERTFHFKDQKAGETQFSVEADGIVLMAVSPRFREGPSQVAPNGGVFAGIHEPWYWDCKSKRDLVHDGWRECGTLPIFDADWPFYFRECKKGESFRIRTEKDLAPILIK